MGIANATVFPDPVLAFPMQSLPCVQVSVNASSRHSWTETYLQEAAVCTPLELPWVSEWTCWTGRLEEAGILLEIEKWKVGFEKI